MSQKQTPPPEGYPPQPRTMDKTHQSQPSSQSEQAVHRTGPLPAELELFDPTEPSFWQRIKYPLRWLLIAGLLIVGLILFKRYELGSYLNQEQIQSWLTPFGMWAPLVFMALFVIAMLLIVIPFSLMCGVGALFFGVAWGTLWSVLGGTLAALAVYGLSKWIGRGVIRKRVGNLHWENLNRRLQQDGFYYLLLMRGLAILPFNLLNFVCAFTAIKLRHFLFANLIGLIPSAFVYGYGTRLLLDPSISGTQLVFLIAIILLIIVPPLVFRQARRARRNAQRTRMQKAMK